MGSCWVALQIIQDNGRHSWKITTPCLKLHQYPFGRQKFKVQEIWHDLELKGISSRSVTSRHIIKRPEVCNDDVNISPKNPPLVILACKKKACKPEHQQHFAKLFSHSSRRLRIYTKFWRCC